MINRKFVLGIDATNLQGGCKNYLLSILRYIDKGTIDFDKIIIWAPLSTLNLLPDNCLIQKRHIPIFEDNYFKRGIWQFFYLSKVARKEGCDLLFIPGGAFLATFSPTVTMYQNLLPFENKELLRYIKHPSVSLKFIFLKIIYFISIRRAIGSIFLSQYAKNLILRSCSLAKTRSIVISHGVDNVFRQPIKSDFTFTNILGKNKIRILYASAIDLYKHPWHVVASVAMLRDATGCPLQLILAGPAAGRAMSRLEASIKQYDPTGAFVQYIGEVPHNAMPDLYASADLAVFASTCENLPMIILEQMAMGLPIACSDHPAMRGLLGDDAEWFDATDPASIAAAIRRMIEDPALCAERVARNRAKADQYQWPAVARETFAFLRAMAEKA